MSLKIGHFADAHYSDRLTLAGEMCIDPATGLSERLIDASRCVNAFTDQAEAFGAELFLVAGDVFDRCRQSPTEERQVISDFERMARIAPVIAIPGNHSSTGIPGEATGLTCLRGRPRIHVAESAGWFDVADGGHVVSFQSIDDVRFARMVVEGHRARVCVLPWISRSQLLADETLAGFTAEQLTGLVSAKVQRLAARLAALRVPGVPHVLLFHGTIEGCDINEQPASLQREIGLRAVDLDPFDLTALGHVHKQQRIAGPPSAWYSGSIDRANVGEEAESKGGLLHIVEPGRVETTIAPTPARPYKTIPVEHILSGGLIEDDGRTVFRVKGAIEPSQVAELRARLDGLAVRHLMREVEVVRERSVRDAGMEGLGEEQLVRRRLEAHEVPAVDVGAFMEVHGRIAARS